MDGLTDCIIDAHAQEEDIFLSVWNYFSNTFTELDEAAKDVEEKPIFKTRAEFYESLIVLLEKMLDEQKEEASYSATENITTNLNKIYEGYILIATKKNAREHIIMASNETQAILSAYAEAPKLINKIHAAINAAKN